MLAQRSPPTAFLCSSIISAFGVRRAVDEAGLKLGRDVSVITHDDDLSYLQNGADDPIFTALRSSVREAGRRAAEMLIGQIRAPGPPVHALAGGRVPDRALDRAGRTDGGRGRCLNPKDI